MKQSKHARRMVLVILLIYLVLVGGTAASFRADAFPRPTWRSVLNGSWCTQLERYLNEDIGFHDVLFRIKSRTDLFIGEKMIQGVYVTDDRLLEKLYAEEAPAPESLADPVNAFCAETGLPTYLVLVPSASEVYRGDLPANAVSDEQSSRIQQIYSATASGVRCIDAYQILYTHKDSYIYYRTDTHWTSYGAYLVYRSVIQKLGFTPTPYERYVIRHMTTSFRGDLYAKTLYDDVKPDLLDRYSNEDGAKITSVTAYDGDGDATDRGTVLYRESALSTPDMYRYYLGTPCDKLVIRTDVESGRKLLLYKDDLADCMVPFLLEHYSEICIIDLARTGARYRAYADPSAYTQALFLCSMERWTDLW